MLPATREKRTWLLFVSKVKIDELVERNNSPFCHFERSEKYLELL